EMTIRRPTPLMRSVLSTTGCDGEELFRSVIDRAAVPRGRLAQITQRSPQTNQPANHRLATTSRWITPYLPGRQPCRPHERPGDSHCRRKMPTCPHSFLPQVVAFHSDSADN